MVGSLDKKHQDLSVGHWLSDMGPVYDCLVWNTGDGFRAAIDISEEGDLSKALNLGVFRETREYGRLCEMSQVNVSVNIYHGGDLLEIVGMLSSHGTHVASIAAANFPDQPERNGLAPGAQIISVNIGDGRLGSMETGTALARALGYVMRSEYYRVDLINMSYGEHTHYAHSGREGVLMAESPTAWSSPQDTYRGISSRFPQVTLHSTPQTGLTPLYPGATWAEVTAKGLSPELGGKFVLHTVQLVPHQSVCTPEHHKMFNIQQGGGEWR